MSPTTLSSAVLLALLLQAQDPDKLTLSVKAERTNAKWTATISGRISDTKLTVVEIRIMGRREHFDKGAIYPIAWKNPIWRKTNVERGAFTLRQEFDRAGTYTIDVILPSDKKLTGTIRVGSAEALVTEAAKQVKKSEELLDLADKALEKFGRAVEQPDPSKAVVKPFEGLREAEAKLSEYARETFHEAAIDETLAVLYEAILYGSWIINVSKRKVTANRGADDDDVGGGKPQAQTKDISKISVADLRARVKDARAVIARETALWAAMEYSVALQTWSAEPKGLESYGRGLKAARDKLGRDFVKEFDPDKVTTDSIDDQIKSAKACEASARKP